MCARRDTIIDSENGKERTAGPNEFRAGFPCTNTVHVNNDPHIKTLYSDANIESIFQNSLVVRSWSDRSQIVVWIS